MLCDVLDRLRPRPALEVVPTEGAVIGFLAGSIFAGLAFVIWFLWYFRKGIWR